MADIAINIKATDNASPQLSKIGKSFSEISTNMESVSKSTNKTASSMKELDKTIENTKGGMTSFPVNIASMMTGVGAALEIAKKAIQLIGKGLTAMANNSEDFKNSLDKLKNVTNGLFKSMGDSTAFLVDALAVGVTNLLKLFDLVDSEMENAKRKAKELDDLRKKQQAGFDEQAQKQAESERFIIAQLESKKKTVKELLDLENTAIKQAEASLKLNQDRLKLADDKKEQLKIIGYIELAKKDIENSKKRIEVIRETEARMNGTVRKLPELIKANQLANESINKSTLSSIIMRERANQESLDNELNDMMDFVEDMKKNKLAAMLEAFKKTYSQINQIVTASLGAISSVMNNIFSALANDSANQLKTLETNYKNLVKSIDDETKKRLESMGLADQTELEKAQEKYDKLLAMNEEYNNGLSELQETQLDSIQEKIVGQSDKEIEEAIRKKREKESNGNQEAINEARKELEKQKILEDSNKKKEQAEIEYHAKKSAIEKQAFETKKQNDIAQVWISTALGVAGAWASAMSSSGNPIVGAVIAGIATAALLANAGIQTGVISSQTYTPAFESGGIVPGSSYSGDRVTAMVNSGEMILNKDQQANLFDMANSGGGGDQYVNIYIDSEMIMQKIITGRKFAEVR
jgi:hypothetical protein